jgi:hypothetical protein
MTPLPRPLLSESGITEGIPVCAPRAEPIVSGGVPGGYAITAAGQGFYRARYAALAAAHPDVRAAEPDLPSRRAAHRDRTQTRWPGSGGAA